MSIVSMYVHRHDVKQIISSVVSNEGIEPLKKEGAAKLGTKENWVRTQHLVSNCTYSKQINLSDADISHEREVTL